MTFELLNVEQVAERLNRTPAALRFMIYKGTAPRSALIQGRRMFKSTDVEAFIAEAFGEEQAS